MRIAQVAPLYESVPPKFYGGTERIVSYLTEELVRQGHEVTLFASADSSTQARLVPGCERALRLNNGSVDHLAHHILLLEHVVRLADEFDLVHFHIDYLHFPLARRRRVPYVTTMHGRLDIPDLQPVFAEFTEAPLVSISDAQRKPLPQANWASTVYHGLPSELYTLKDDQPGKYLVFLGRIAPEKGVDRAIEIASRAGLDIKIAAKIDGLSREYFRSVVEPLLRQPGVEYLGELGDREKQALLSDALALLFPIEWPEPFGIVMIEAMACGVPVIAYSRGSVPEVIDDGVTGFLVEGIDAAVRAVERANALSRRRCRATFEQRFSVGRMAGDYLKTYERLLGGLSLARTA